MSTVPTEAETITTPTDTSVAAPRTAPAVPASLSGPAQRREAAPRPAATRPASAAPAPGVNRKAPSRAPRQSTTPPPPAAKDRISSAPVTGGPVTGGPADRNIGGVAPVIGPPTWLDRFRAGRALERRGFVPLSPGRPKLRHRILPRSVIGIASLLMSMGVGAAFCGAAFYAYYDNRLAENEREVARFVEGFDQQFTDASSALDELRVDSVDQIRQELAPLGEYVSDANAVVGLPQEIGGSVWLLQSRDDSGRPTVGSAFAVADHRAGSALLTSYALVRSSTVSPGPGIELTKDGEKISAALWAWDEAHDLALIVTDQRIPALTLADPDAQVSSVGGRVFAMSGMGGQGATASPGVLLDRSAAGLQHTAVVGTAFVGGPLVDGAGVILGVATANYRPLGIDPGAVAQAPDVTAICAEILSCADAPSPARGEGELSEED